MLTAVTALLDVAARTWPVLAFLCLVTVVAELADEAGVFALAGHHAARLGGGSVRRLLALVCVLATLTTMTLSLDTTVVLVTPVALTLVRTLALPPRPFTYACVWLANGASLLLPVSNLTNLLAQDRLGLTTAGFATALWRPQAAVLAVTLAVLWLRHRRDLRGRYPVPAAPPPHDRVLVVVGAVAAGVVAAGTVLGLPAWSAAALALVVLVAGLGVRRPVVVRPRHLVRLVPWRTALQTAALFAAAGLLRPVLRPAVRLVVGGGGDGVWPLLAVVAGAAVVANLVNNLPAYLLLETGTGDRSHLLAVLVGVGAGPQLLAHGSVATLLWRDRLRSAGLEVSAGELAREGALLVPLALLAATAALASG